MWNSKSSVQNQPEKKIVWWRWDSGGIFLLKYDNPPTIIHYLIIKKYNRAKAQKTHPIVIWLQSHQEPKIDYCPLGLLYVLVNYMPWMWLSGLSYN